MDITPKSKQPSSSLKRRPLGLCRSARTKLLKTEASSSDSVDTSVTSEERNDSSINETAVPIPEQQCTPVRSSSLQNEMSPQYPHMFRIFHDDSPEFRVGWDDGISEMVTKKHNPCSDTSIHSRTIASQQMKRSLRKFSTPPRLKQQQATADVNEYKQWAKSLIEKARSCSDETPSPSETQTSNTTIETAKKDSSCDKIKYISSTSTKETLLTSRRSLPISSSTCTSKDVEIIRKSLPTESQYSNFFDDSANDDMFVQCTQAVEDSLLKDKQPNQESSKTVNNNVIIPSKITAVASKPQLNKEVKTGQSSNLEQSLRSDIARPNFTKPNKVITNNTIQPKSVQQPGAASNYKVQLGASNFVQKVQSVGPTVMGRTVTSSITSSTPSGGSKNFSLTSKDSNVGVQLLDEDDDFLSSLDLQSLSQMNPPRSATVPSKSTNIDKTTSSCIVNSAKNVNSTKRDASATENSVSASNRIANPVPLNVNASKCISNSVVPNAAKIICTQEAIKRKREEAQRRLQSKMQRHF